MYTIFQYPHCSHYIPVGDRPRAHHFGVSCGCRPRVDVLEGGYCIVVHKDLKGQHAPELKAEQTSPR